MLNRIGGNGQLDLLPGLRRNVFGISPLVMMNTNEFLPYICFPYWSSELKGLQNPRTRWEGCRKGYYTDWVVMGTSGLRKDEKAWLCSVRVSGSVGRWQKGNLGEAEAETVGDNLTKAGTGFAETQCIGGRSPSGHRTKVSEMRIRVPLLTSAQVNSESILFIFIIIYVFFHHMWSEKVTGLSLELPVWLSWQRVGGSWPHAPNGRQLSKLLCGYQGAEIKLPS